MPTILVEDGFAVRIWPNDHAPPHVHVAKGDGMARVALGDPVTRPRPLSASA